MIGVGIIPDIGVGNWDNAEGDGGASLASPEPPSPDTISGAPESPAMPTPPPPTPAPIPAPPEVPAEEPEIALPDDDNGMPDIVIEQTVEAVPLPILPTLPVDEPISGGGFGGGGGGGMPMEDEIIEEPGKRKSMLPTIKDDVDITGVC